MMRMFKWMLSILVALTLGACGGGGGSAGDSPFVPDPGTQPARVSSLTVSLGSPTIPNTGTGSVTATITALDANRNAVAGASVNVSVGAPAIATVQGTAGSVTNSAGQLVVTLTVPSGSVNGDVTITAQASGVSATNTLRIVDSPAGAVPASVEIIASATSVGTSGDSVLLTAFVKDLNNNALPAASVAFAATTGTLSSVSTSTNTAGAATATFSAGADRSNREATVRVTAGTVSGTLRLPIVGTTMKVSGPSSLVLGNSANYDVVLTDSKGNVLPGVPVTGSSLLGNSLTSSSTVTDANGQIRFRFVTSRAGTDQLTFNGAGAASPQQTVTVSGQDFKFTSPAAGATIDVGAWAPVTVQLLSGLAAQPNQTVAFSATGGSLSAASAITDVNGSATVNVRSFSAGPVTIEASTSVDGSPVSATLALVVVATTPSKLVLQVNPAAIAPSTGVATVIAKVTDASGNPVQGKTVNFTRVTDPSGGNLLQTSAPTDVNGQAIATYQAGGQSTADKGVVLRAEVASSPSVFGTAALTVNQASLFIALGTGNVIGNLDAQTYKKDWVTYVTDSNGIPVNGATLTIKSIPNFYRTGELVFSDADNLWVYLSPIYQCRNEDRDSDGVLRAGGSVAVASATPNGASTTVSAPGHAVQVGDVVTVTSVTSPVLNGDYQVSRVDANSFDIPVDSTGLNLSGLAVLAHGEDDNLDGVLWPGNVIAVSPSTVQTVDGRATLSLLYAESYAPWVEVNLSASATVSGTESSTTTRYLVAGSAPDFSVKTTPPAGAISPFGAARRPGAVCTLLVDP